METIAKKNLLKKVWSANTSVDCIKFFNPYKIHDENGEFFASITHERSNIQRLFNLFRMDKTKSYAFKITGPDGATFASVQRSNSIWHRRFRVFDQNNNLAYTICPKIKFNKLSFNVINSDDMHVAKIVGNASNSSFAMHDVYNHVIAIIHKKNIHDTFCATEYANPFDKNVLLATAICVGLYAGA